MAPVLTFADPVTLAGGAPFESDDLAAARAIAPVLIAADRGADRLAALDEMPEAIIGDMDSARPTDARVIRIEEQDTTDFEKCLYTVSAPFFIGVGFTGRRLDHTLATLHAMLRRPSPPVVLISAVEVVAILPPRPVHLALAAGERVSLFPLRPVRGVASKGLQWPIEDLAFAPGVTIGTSNRTIADEVTIEMGGPGAVLMLPRHRLTALVDAVCR